MRLTNVERVITCDCCGAKKIVKCSDEQEFYKVIWGARVEYVLNHVGRIKDLCDDCFSKVQEALRNV